MNHGAVKSIVALHNELFQMTYGLCRQQLGSHGALGGWVVGGLGGMGGSGKMHKLHPGPA